MLSVILQTSQWKHPLCQFWCAHTYKQRHKQNHGWELNSQILALTKFKCTEKISDLAVRVTGGVGALLPRLVSLCNWECNSSKPKIMYYIIVMLRAAVEHRLTCNQWIKTLSLNYICPKITRNTTFSLGFYPRDEEENFSVFNLWLINAVVSLSHQTLQRLPAVGVSSDASWDRQPAH